MRVSIILSIATLFSMLFLTGCGSAVLAEDSSSSSAAVSKQTIDLINTTGNPGAVEIGESLIPPSSPLYFLKTIRENIELMLSSTPKAKVAREVEFATRRLREVKTLVKNGKQDLIASALERYSLAINEAIQETGNDEELKAAVGEAISRHLDVLQRVYDQVGNPQAKMSIRAAILRTQNLTNEMLVKLSLPVQQDLIKRIAERLAFVCQFISREATTSGLNDSEKVYLSEQEQKCRQNVEKNLKDQLQDSRKKRLIVPAASK